MTNERLYELALHIKTNHKDNPWEGNSFQSSLDSIDRSIIDVVAAAVRAECEQDAKRYREVLEQIANQGPNYGPDGTYKTWKHWADIARDGLTQQEPTK